MKRKSQKKDVDKVEDKSDKDDKSDKSNKEEIIEDKKDLEVDKRDDSQEKALFVQRLGAYIIDAIIVTFIVSLISTPFVDNKRLENLNSQANSITEKFIDNEISSEEYIVQYSNVGYDLARSNGLRLLLKIFVCILYYIVFQLYNKGSTIGKQILGIKVVSTTGDLSMNQMIFRTFLANFLLLNILSMAFLVFASRDIYFACVGLFSMIQYAIVIVSLFMIMYSKEGLAIHDKLVHTKVIRNK